MSRLIARTVRVLFMAPCYCILMGLAFVYAWLCFMAQWFEEGMHD